ncbi:MAG: hypothetical protein GY708_13520 [Actinomycetia bacterium]|nr:hypothetical protein [Actinomycetes bacterium]
MNKGPDDIVDSLPPDAVGQMLALLDRFPKTRISHHKIRGEVMDVTNAKAISLTREMVRTSEALYG